MFRKLPKLMTMVRFPSPLQLDLKGLDVTDASHEGMGSVWEARGNRPVRPNRGMPPAVSQIGVGIFLWQIPSLFTDIRGALLEQTLSEDHRLQSISASRFTAGAFGFFDSIQCSDRPEM